MASSRGESVATKKARSDNNEEEELPVVKISISGNLVTLKFSEEEDDEAEFEAREKLRDSVKIGNISHSNGSPPRGENFRALLKCNNGIISYDNVRYRIEVVTSGESTTQSGRVLLRGLPEPDYDDSLPNVDSPTRDGGWESYQSSSDNGHTLFRYVRHAIVSYGFWRKDLKDANQIKISLQPSSDPSLTHVDHRSTASSAEVIAISGVSEQFDGRYRVKYIQNKGKWQKEAFVNQLLCTNTTHSAFLIASLAFRCRFTDDGPDQFAIAVKLEDAWNLRQATASTDIVDNFTEEEILRGLAHLLDGRMKTDTRVIPRNDGVALQWTHGDHHPGNILVWRSPTSRGLRRFAYIDFASSDVLFRGAVGLQRLYGSVGKQTESGTLLTPSGATEAQELVQMFVALLIAGKYSESADYLARRGIACTLASTYNAVKARMGQLGFGLNVQEEERVLLQT